MMKVLTKVAGVAALTAMLSAPSAFAAAGPVSFGIKGGVGLSKTNVDGASYGLGFMGGLALDVGAGPFGATIDALYAIRKMGYPGDSKISISQILVPLQLKFSVAPMVRLTAGGYLGYGIGDVTASIGSVSASTTYEASSMEKMDYGLAGGLGVGVGPLLIEARYLHGLKNLSTAAGADVKFSSIDFLVGYMF